MVGVINFGTGVDGEEVMRSVESYRNVRLSLEVVYSSISVDPADLSSSKETSL